MTLGMSWKFSKRVQVYRKARWALMTLPCAGLQLLMRSRWTVLASGVICALGPPEFPQQLHRRGDLSLASVPGTDALHATPICLDSGTHFGKYLAHWDFPSGDNIGAELAMPGPQSKGRHLVPPVSLDEWVWCPPPVKGWKWLGSHLLPNGWQVGGKRGGSGKKRP